MNDTDARENGKTDVKVKREPVSFTVVCDKCGKEWESEGEWLEKDPCMPKRVSL